MIKIVIDRQTQTPGGCQHDLRELIIDCPELENELVHEEIAQDTSSPSILYAKVVLVEKYKAPTIIKETSVVTACT